MQFVATVLAVGEWENVGHPLHCNGPGNTLYVPAPHGAHVPPSGPEYPALHLQAANAALCSFELALSGHVRHVEFDVAPTVEEYFPAKQLLHAPAPEEFLYCPAKHGVHVCPLEPG